MANKVVSTHLEERKKALNEIKSNNELSTKVFESSIEKEKTELLNKYLKIYEKALSKTEELENEKTKLNRGKKTYEKDEKGELVEKSVFDEQAVQRLKKIDEQLKNLYSGIDKAMAEGSYGLWENLDKLSK